MNASKNLNNLESNDIANLATAILRLNDSVSTLNSLVLDARRKAHLFG